MDGEVSRRLPTDIQQIARRKLRMLNNAKQLKDLFLPTSNNLELLKGDREGQYSIRINRQWRLCFHCMDGYADGVIIEDYH